MGLVFNSKKEIDEYVSTNGSINIRAVAISSLEHLLKKEKLSLEELSTLFCTDRDEVEEILKRNGIIYP